MEGLKLKTKELLVLSAQIGAGNFYGIGDPFFGMSKEEVWREISEIQLQLEERKLVSLGFDDSVEINSTAKEIVSVCALCEKYLAINWISCGKIMPKRLLYMKDGAISELLEDGDSVSLQISTSENFINSVMDSVFAGCDDKAHPSEPIQVHQDLLVRAQPAGAEHSQMILQEESVLPEMASVIADGFNQTGQYCMITAIDLTRNTMSDYVCITGNAGSVQVAVVDEYENLWQISWVTKSSIAQKLHSVIQRLSNYEVISNETD